MTVFTLKSDLPIFPIFSKEKPGNYEAQVQAQSVSDGHHTMEELYEHRHALFIALCKTLDSYVTPLQYPHIKCWKSEKHHDGTSFEGWFLLGMSYQKIPFNAKDPIEVQHIAYHLPMKYWNKIDVLALHNAPPYEGYTSEDVLQRLLKL